MRRIFIADSWLVTVFAALQAALYISAAIHTGQSPALLLACGMVLPFAFWLWMAGFVFYVHHTDETTRWFDDETEWRRVQPNLDGTHGSRLPLRIDLVLHHALEHTAHHVNPAIPCYRLTEAQRALENHYPTEVPRRSVTMRRYVEITRACQLYDGRQQRWVTFAEVDTAPIVVATR